MACARRARLPFFSCAMVRGLCKSCIKLPILRPPIGRRLHAGQESSVRCKGTVVEDDRSQTGVEMHGAVFEMISAAIDYPIAPKKHGVDFLMDNRHLWHRSPKQWAIMRVRDTLERATMEFLHDNGFIRFDAPILTPNACEGTTTLYKVDHFGRSAYLTQSGQLYLEAGIFGHRRVYDFGPVFRAEKSKTRRHLNEFWMMDAEAAFVDWQGNMQPRRLDFVHAQARLRGATLRVGHGVGA